MFQNKTQREANILKEEEIEEYINEPQDNCRWESGVPEGEEKGDRKISEKSKGLTFSKFDENYEITNEEAQWSPSTRTMKKTKSRPFIIKLLKHSNKEKKKTKMVKQR